MTIVNTQERLNDPIKCYCCESREAIGTRCEDCNCYYCMEHAGCTDEKPDAWNICDWCYEVRYLK